MKNLSQGFNLKDVPGRLAIKEWREADPFADTLGLLNGIKDFSPLTQFPNLRRLWVSGAKQDQLDVIGELTQLECLCVSLPPSTNDLRPLGRLTNLRDLSFDGQIDGALLEPLANLVELRRLFISAQLTSYKTLYFDAFAPLGSLTKLEHLELYGVKPRDESLVPLTRLRNLKRLGMSNIFLLAEMARMAAALPNTEGIFHDPVLELGSGQGFECKKCGREKRIMLVGRSRSSFPCGVCDAKLIENHIAEYERFKGELAPSP